MGRASDWCVGALACIFVWIPARAGGPPGYRIETIAGSANQGDGGPAAAAQFGTIKGVAVDARGNLYIADTDHHQIRKVDSGNSVSTLAGIGTPGYSGDGGPAAAARLNFPYGVAVDAAGYVYVADYGNNVIRRITPGGVIQTYAGTGMAGYSGDGGQAADARILSPRNVTLDSAGNLYLSEFGGHRVRKVAANGVISTVAGTGLAGYTGDGYTATAAELHSPAGLAVDRDGALYIADSGNGCIRVVRNGVISTRGNFLGGLVGVAVRSDGTLYGVTAGTAVWGLSPAAGSRWYVAAGNNGAGFSGDGGGPAAAQVAAVWDAALPPAGTTLYFADGPRVRSIANLLTEPILHTVAGDGYLSALGDGHAATAAILQDPVAAILDGAGSLYVSDYGAHRVRRVVPAGTIQTVAGNGSAGVGQDGVPAVESSLFGPGGLAAGPAGDLFIADTGNQRIRRVDATGVISSFAGTGLTPYAGQAPDAPPALQADGLAALQVNLFAPRGVCADRSGAVFIVDTENNRVLRASTRGAAVATAAGNGAAGDLGDGGPAPLAQLTQPAACALDTAGNLYIADTYSHRVRKVTAATGNIGTVAGTGLAGYSGDGGPATAAQLDAPTGVAAQDDGTVFIADTHNHRIRMVSPDGAIRTIAGQGSPGLSGDGGDAAGALLNAPAGLALDGAGSLYFADSGNHRVRRLVPEAAPPPPPPVVTAPALSAVNAASQVQAPVAPGEIVTIFGQAIGPSTGAQADFSSSGMLPVGLEGTEVRFDGLPAPLLYAQYGQVNVQVPYAVAGNTSTHIEAFYKSQSVGTVDLSVATANPALFPVALNQDGSVNSESNPAARGTALIFFATGEGLTSGGNVSGMAAQPPYPRPALPVALMVGGIPCTLLYAGSAPRQTGELQVNAVVPGGFLPSGPAAAQLRVGDFTSPPFTVWVQ